MERKLKKIMTKILGINENDINEESSRKNIKAWDSLKHIRLVLAIEEEFDVEPFDMDQIVEMTSYIGIKRILREKGVDI
jgi:acyl carrier protein